jgi:YhcH/YjgK/YiaL family protein
LILDTIENFGLYSGLKPEIKKALEFLKKGDFEKKKAGTYDLEDGIYYMVQEIQTRPEEGAFFESHRKYIDIQFFISGAALHGYAPLATLKVKDVYDKEKDVAFYNGNGSLFTLSAGSFAVYFPNDAHKPDLVIKEPAKAKKIVIKVPVGKRG